MALLLHVLMVFLLSGGLARVVTDFELECGQFFANGKSPTRFFGLQYKQICQTLNGVPYYATYYDTYNRIPVYSAYRFEGIMHCTRLNKWYIEPQLDDDKAGEDMASEASVDINLRGVHQALNKDYEKSGYHKGHLAPVYQAESQSCADATFTLTNAAPQNPHFNSVLWWNVEKMVAKYLARRCISQTVYIVTGVIPGTTNIKNRVNVPSHFWTAFCCLDQNYRCSKSRGVIGTNENNSVITEKPVADLERELQNLYGTRTPFSLFQY
ncbi:endonuclease domain-containing 1 protein-like [Rhinichthys klamathensis goyatoka]|uniref:endonuclease domain-containing 1 protein-like n=1 Tax=Rhinichthys klamathensis goyatoka TaxID=3034132 RepID=UPI0024B51295|nr:endonuclease domain-containing 1 protein-like [Rhinichthys klamathensis goyatoka]